MGGEYVVAEDVVAVADAVVFSISHDEVISTDFWRVLADVDGLTTYLPWLLKRLRTFVNEAKQLFVCNSVNGLKFWKSVVVLVKVIKIQKY